MPFRNKHRMFRNHGFSLRHLFGAVILFVLTFVTTILINRFVLAAPYTDVIKSIELTSQHTSYTNSAPGSWHVTKSAQWIEEGKARITFDVDTVRKTADGYRDIIMVIDNSGSMSGDKIAQVKHDAAELINSVLSNTANRVALVSFNTNATKLSGFTNNKTNLIGLINDLNTPGSTNYYDGFKKAEEILEGYQKQSNRELIMLFLTDGYPNQDTPNEVAEYRALKQTYPYMTINGIQYEMGDEILEPVANVSDNQFIANINSLNNVLFEASVAPYTYGNFTITDYIDDTYWNVASIDDISASIGNADLTFDGSTPKVTWTMNEALVSGKTAQLTIDVTLKNNLNLPDNSFLPTNKSETITSELPNTSNESISSTLTPVLKANYKVSYEANVPDSCNSYTGTLPNDNYYAPHAVIQKSTNTLFCDGYNFNGWEIAEGNPKIINDDYFKIINDDVTLRAVWTKLSISKTMDGEVSEEATAILDTGQNVNGALKRLSGQSSAVFSTSNSIITAIKSASSMSATQQSNATIISANSSSIPIYAWFDSTDGTIYIYSDAAVIKGNENMDNMFYRMTALTDITGLATWNTSSVTNMFFLFQDDSSLANIDALENWNTSSVTNMSGMFSGASSLANIDALENWNTSSVTDMYLMFQDASSLTNINGAVNWDTSNVTSMQYMFRRATNLSNIDGASGWNTSSVTTMQGLFSSTKIADINALTNWNTSNVANMGSMFSGTKITDVDALANWNTSNVTSMGVMFSGASSLTNIDGAANWDTSSVTSMRNMFNGTSNLTDIDGASSWNISSVKSIGYLFEGASSLTNIDALSNWDTSSVTDMSYTFRNASSITDIDALTNWNTSSVTSMASMFQNASSLTNIDGAANWDTSSVTSMNQMFRGASSLANIDGASSWNTSSVTNMYYMFYNDTQITDLSPLNSWNVSSTTDMRNMFNGIPSSVTRPNWYNGS